jgi:hypothetical protein
MRRITPLQCRISPATFLIDIGNRPWLIGLPNSQQLLCAPHAAQHYILHPSHNNRRRGALPMDVV